MLSTQHWQCGAASLYMRAILEQSGASIHPSLLSQKESPHTSTKRSTMWDASRTLKASNELGVIPRRYGRHRGRQATYFSLGKTAGRTSESRSPTEIYPQIMPYHAFHEYYPSSAKKSVMLSARNFAVYVSTMHFQHLAISFCASRAICICSLVEGSSLHTMIYIILSPEAEFRSHATTSSVTENCAEHILVLTLTFYRHWSSC